MRLAMPVAVLLVTTTFGSCFIDESHKLPTVFISVLVRNKAHVLPYFFSGLTNLAYPKDRIHIWIYSDFNQDDSVNVINQWANKYGSQYQAVNVTVNRSSGYLHADERNPTHWSSLHFQHIIKLREDALNIARDMWADYILAIDADVCITEPNTLIHLISKRLKVVAPMLLSDGLYSNFWCDMTQSYYYKRTDDYKKILSRENIGCMTVPMVHSAVLIDLRLFETDRLTYDPKKILNYDGPEDDIIAFAISARNNGIHFNICNDLVFGFVPVPLDDNEDLSNDEDQLLNIKMEAISRGRPFPLDTLFENRITYPIKTKYGCDEIYMINLKRRKERRRLMESSFLELGMDVRHFNAVDGSSLDMDNVKKFGVRFMPDYKDPFHNRPMKSGEVGCFLSHYYIWEDIVGKGYNTTLIIEDDIHFAPYFRHRFQHLLKELKSLDWDLVYIGRKILLSSDEEQVTEHIVKPKYSYWTLGYLLSQRGARKLINAKPLNNLLPVDEFLPIMFGQHPNADWNAHFPVRKLKALSASPVLVSPTHYTGQPGYISDTEDSTIVDADGVPINAKNEL